MYINAKSCPLGTFMLGVPWGGDVTSGTQQWPHSVFLHRADLIDPHFTLTSYLLLPLGSCAQSTRGRPGEAHFL